MTNYIPTTPRLTSGTLESSGVKYYLCENENPNDSIVLTLIVHVGSLMENDDEQGLAHFIEHLGFKSTKSFEHYELVKFLESLGISYGPDLNASTHLLETVFKLNIKYDNECSQISMGINVLSEWAYHMTISEKDVNEERQVISAEYMAKQGLGNRLLKKYWKAIFGKSDDSFEPTTTSDQASNSHLLSKRFPIGVPEVFMNCNNEHIRRFYQQWYQPENMSVLVCGALHGRQQEIINLLDSSFSLSKSTTTATPTPTTSDSVPSSVPISVPTSVLTPDTLSLPLSTVTHPTTRCQQLQDQYLVLPSFHSAEEDVVVAMVDADLSSTQICFEFFTPVHKSRTEDFIRQDVIRRLMSSILDKRFNELHKTRGNIPLDAITSPGPGTGPGSAAPGRTNDIICSPFLSVQISIREFVRGLVCIGVSATLKDISNDNDDCNNSEAQFIKKETTENGEYTSSSNNEEEKQDASFNSNTTTANTNKGTLNVAVQSLLLEMKRLRCLGANQIELDNAKGKWLTFFTQQKNKHHVDNSYMMSELQNYVLNGEKVPFASPATEAQICIDIIESLSLDEMNDFLRCTFDMDVMPSDSLHYYNESDNGKKCFRALSGQFPRSFPGGTGSEDDSLRDVLEDARVAVAQVVNMEVWPSHDHIDESVVIDFAQRALDLCRGYDNNVTDVDGNVETAGGGDAFIREENYVESLDCSEIVLSNGITVCCKWMAKESQSKVSMQAFSLGGSSELSPVADLLMSGLDEVAGHSSSKLWEGTAVDAGTSDSDVEISIGSACSLDGKDILELQSVAHSRVNTQRHQHHRGIGGSATSDKIELLLAFLVIKMTSQRIDRIHFDDWINKKKAQLKHSSQSPEFVFMNRSRVLACGDEPNFRPITLELVEEASGCYDEMCDLYKKAFQADPTEFSFVFTGDIGDKEHFLDLLVRYLGKLRPHVGIIQDKGCWLLHSSSPVETSTAAGASTSTDAGALQQHQSNNCLYPFRLLNSSSVVISSPVEETMCLLNTEDNKSSMMLIFRADMRKFLNDDDDLVYTVTLDAACRVLQVCLLDELRIKLGKVYNVNVEKSRSSLCTFSLISIGLHCQPSDVHVVKVAIRTVLSELQLKGPDVSKLTSVQEAMCKTHKDSFTNASYWLFWILDSYKAYKLHQWRQKLSMSSPSITSGAYAADLLAQLDNTVASSRQWLEKNGWLRANGKLSIIKEDINCLKLQNIYQSVFDLNQSILMNLMPKISPKEDRSDDKEGQSKLKEVVVGARHGLEEGKDNRTLVEVSS